MQFQGFGWLVSTSYPTHFFSVCLRAAKTVVTKTKTPKIKTPKTKTPKIKTPKTKTLLFF